jgi:hypothetical protein
MDRLLRPVHRWVWGDFDRRVRKLLAFGEVESDGGRDILRAAELTPDPLLRRLYLEHAIDELHHGDLFRQRGAALLRTRSTRLKTLFNGTPLPGGHGLDDLSVQDEPDHRLLAFLHIAEKAAAGRFTIGGIAKGSGMIEPNMATMLGFVTTDAQVPSPLLPKPSGDCPALTCSFRHSAKLRNSPSSILCGICG